MSRKKYKVGDKVCVHRVFEKCGFKLSIGVVSRVGKLYYWLDFPQFHTTNVKWYYKKGHSIKVPKQEQGAEQG